ncbi:YbeD family protein [Aliikangiella sp. IMCC44632]
MSDKVSDTGDKDPSEELWQFPCQFMFKAMAFAQAGVEDEIVAVIQRFVPGDYTPKLNPSRTGKYVAVSVTFTATSKQQLDEIYLAVNALDCVKVCL